MALNYGDVQTVTTGRLHKESLAVFINVVVTHEGIVWRVELEDRRRSTRVEGWARMYSYDHQFLVGGDVVEFLAVMGPLRLVPPCAGDLPLAPG